MLSSSSTSTPPDQITSTILALQDLAQTYLYPALPAPLPTILQTFLSSLHTFTPVLRRLYNVTSSFIAAVLSSTNNNGGGSVSSSPEVMALLTTLVLVVSVYMSLQMMNYIRRAIWGWVMFVIKMTVLFIVLQVGWYIHLYGWEKFIRDASWWGGVIWGLAEDAMDGKEGKIPRGMRSRANSNAYRSSGPGSFGKQRVPMGTRGRGRWD